MLQLRSAPGWLRQAVDRLGALGLPALSLSKGGHAAPPHTKASAIGPLICLSTPHQPAWAPRDYAGFAREGFAQNAVVYRAVRMIAEAAANVPLLLYEGDVEIMQHPLIDLVARPNPVSSTPDLLEAWYGFLLVSGNAYLEAVAVGGQIRELHALRPDRMKVIPGPDGWPEAFEYTAGGNSVRFAGEAAPGVRPVLHVKLFNPVNDHYGMSPIEAAATAIDIHNTAARWNKALLDNSARPSGALVYTSRDGNLSPEQYERLKSELEQGFQGAAHAGRPLLLEGGLDWKSMSLSPKDMDFIEAKHAAAREIALALGVPPMLLGIPGDNTYSNYAEANRTFWRQTVLPLVNRTAKALSAWLSPAYATDPALSLSKGGAALELRPDLDAIEALSPEREALWARLEKATFLTADEKRSAVGYAPLDEVSDPAGLTPSPKANFNLGQLRDEVGRWVDEGGGGVIRRVQSTGRPGYSINILEEDALGGHTFERHVNKPEEYLKARILGSRRNVLGIVSVGEKRAGSFTSLEAANKLVNSTLSKSQENVDAFVGGRFPFSLPVMYVHADFDAPTGYEAYAPNDRAQPTMRTTFGVTVRIVRTDRNSRGYYVHSAWPTNRD
jgi:HK97 family phage portal protein